MNDKGADQTTRLCYSQTTEDRFSRGEAHMCSGITEFIKHVEKNRLKSSASFAFNLFYLNAFNKFNNT